MNKPLIFAKNHGWKDAFLILWKWIVSNSITFIELRKFLKEVMMSRITFLASRSVWLHGTVHFVTKYGVSLKIVKVVFFAYISGTTFKATKMLFTSICILVERAFRWKMSFWSPVTKSAYVCKNAGLTEESKLLEKIRHFKKFKNFSSWI